MTGGDRRGGRKVPSLEALVQAGDEVRLPVRPGDLVAGGGVQSRDAILDKPAVVGVEELGGRGRLRRRSRIGILVGRVWSMALLEGAVSIVDSGGLFGPGPGRHG